MSESDAVPGCEAGFTEDELAEFGDEEFDAVRKVQILRHLTTCDACLKVVVEFQVIRRAYPKAREANATVYVRLKNEGVEAYAPTPARRLEANVFEILTPTDYNPSAEEWEFTPGTVVKCEERLVGARRELIAIRRITTLGFPR